MINVNKGYAYALLSALLLSGSTLTNKYLLGFVNSRMLSFLFFISVFAGSSALLLQRSRRGFFSNLARHWKDGVIVGGFNAIAASFFFLALSMLDASTTSFLARFSTIFIILIGVFFLKEKLTLYDYPGMLLAVFGALVMNYRNGAFTSLGLVVALAAALGIAFHQITAKMFVRRVDPLVLVNLRTLFSSFFLLLVAAATSAIQPVPLRLIPLIFITGSVVAMLGFFFFYRSLELMDVSKAAVIRTVDPFIILVYSFLIFGSTPSFQEIIGGSLIVAGVTVIILKHRIREIVDEFKLPWLGALS